MRIDRITLKGFTTFKDEATLDLAGLGSGLIAIAGPNGAGKSTILESIPGCLYRQAPSRGQVAALATARDARIELVGENGSPFTARLDVDAHTGKSEAVLLDAAGEPVAGPKVRDYDRAVAEKFPPLSVYLAAAFACQTGAGSLLKMERADRRELFGRLLGLERLEIMATTARERARAAETEIAGIRSALAAVKEGSAEAGNLETALAEAKERAAKAAEALASVQDQVRAAVAERDRLAADRIEAQRAEKAAQEAQGRADRLGKEADAVRRDLGALDAILGEAMAIRQHAADIVTRETKLTGLRSGGESAAAAERTAADEAARLERESTAAERSYRDAEQAQGDSLTKIQEAKFRLNQAVNATGAVPCADAIPDEERAGCSALVGHFRIRDEAKKAIAKLEASLPELQGRSKAAFEAKETAVSKALIAAGRARAARSNAEHLRSEYKHFSDQLTGMRAKDQTPKLIQAEAEAGALRGRLQAILAQASEAKAAADKAAAECPKVDNKRILESEEAARKAEWGLKEATEADQKARMSSARLEAQLESAKAAEAKSAELTARITPLERDLAEWRFLSRGLGREGIQALELDAAGPRVSALANELLADAYGPRFQIRFETQAAKADGKGVKETFDIVVVDNERGREGNGEDLSGGEKVIIGEALGLAVGLFHAQSAGISLGTVVRDETVGALDPENGERYIAMLRSFLRAGRVHQLLFVAHQPALVDLADAVVRIENGKIEVRA
jgi:exonuclease SbcC